MGEVTPQTPRPTNLTSVFDCYTEASLHASRYYRDGTKNQSRLITFVPDMVAEVEEAAHLATLELVVGAQWQVHRVSPLWGVPYTAGGAAREEEGMGACPNVRRLVGEQEGQEVYDRKSLARLGKAMAEVVGGQVEVRIEPLPGLRGTRFDREALQVTVRSEMEGKEVKAFTGVLCGTEVKELNLRHGSAVSLPVFLTQGSGEVTEQVVAGLERCFDCVVGRLHLPPTELQWMSAMWAGIRLGDLKDREDETEEEFSGNEVMKLVYGPPAALLARHPALRQQVSAITFEFPADKMRAIWRACREEGSSGEFTQREMEAFHASIGEHLRQAYSIRVEKLDLEQVQLPFLKATAAGRVLFQAVEQVRTVLRYLTGLSQGEVQAANPTLATTEVEVDNISMDYTVYRGET